MSAEPRDDGPDGRVDEQAVSQALRAVTSAPAVPDTLRQVVDAARTLLRADYAALGLSDGSGGFSEFHVAGIPDEQWERIGPVPRAHGILGALLTDPRPVRVADVRTEPGFTSWPAAHPEMGPFLGVPVRAPVADGADSSDSVDAPEPADTSNDEFGNAGAGALYVCNRAGGSEFDKADERRLTGLAGQVATAIVRARMVERDREHTLLAERARIARDLHDAVAQKLFSLRLTVGAAASVVDGGPAAAHLASAGELAGAALEELRAIVAELRPAALREDGLVPALRKHLALVGRAYRVGIGFSSDCDGRCALPDELERAVFRIAQEAVHNAVRHAGPASIEVTLRTAEPGFAVLLEVLDDGAGFDTTSVATGGGHHLGILSMKERARDVGGRVRVNSRAGLGTRVRLEVP